MDHILTDHCGEHCTSDRHCVCCHVGDEQPIPGPVGPPPNR